MKANEFLKKPIDSSIYIKEMAKELARFTKSLEDMSTSNGKDMGAVLELLLAAVEKMKVEIPAAQIRVAVPEIQFAKKWDFKISRGSGGFMTKVTAERVE